MNAETIYSGETESSILTVGPGPIMVELQLDPEWMGFPVPSPVFLSSDEARLLADALLRAADEVAS